MLVIDALCLAVPSSTVHEEAVDQDSILGSLFHLAWFLSFDYIKRESKLVNGDFVLTGMSLKASGHETLREEHARDPVGNRVTIPEPHVKEVDALDEIFEPTFEGFERRIGNLGPVSRNLTVRQAQEHGIEIGGHDDKTANSLH